MNGRKCHGYAISPALALLIFGITMALPSLENGPNPASRGVGRIDQHEIGAGRLKLHVRQAIGSLAFASILIFAADVCFELGVSFYHPAHVDCLAVTSITSNIT